MRKTIVGGLAAILLATTTAAVGDDDWVAKSNEHARIVLEEPPQPFRVVAVKLVQPVPRIPVPLGPPLGAIPWGRSLSF